MSAFLPDFNPIQTLTRWGAPRSVLVGLTLASVFGSFLWKNGGRGDFYKTITSCSLHPLRGIIVQTVLDHDMEKIFKEWLMAHELSILPRCFKVRPMYQNDPNPMKQQNPYDSRLTLEYQPYMSGRFWYKGTLYFWDQTLANKDNVRAQTTLYSLGSVSNVKTTLNDIQIWHNERQKGKICVCVGSPTYPFNWLELRRPSTLINSVILSEDVIGLTLGNIKEFFQPSTRAWYARQSIPYRRGFLLHGLPGTGKTCLIEAIAGELGVRIYRMPVESIGSRDFALLIYSIAPGNLVVFEDLDRVRGLGDDEEIDDDKGEDRERRGSPLAALLAEIDNLLECVIFITANDRAKLSKALIRSGRVDVEIEFTHATDDQIKRMFLRMYSIKLNDLKSGRLESKDVEPGDPKPDGLESQATEFVNALAGVKLTTADLQNFLIANKKGPEMALKNVHGLTSVEPNTKTQTKREKREREAQARAKGAEGGSRWFPEWLWA